ncbi:putative major pilin subunit [Anaerohalosphaera lusitana]|uniref:Putative major pilin subunit n=1 Tax=Anaerohalosphaera lusitana TaxID=1936003 RepID=A0A1U9NKI5_9BACT|nr:type II secretion system protein [Anaerohalosphaera lusitana]AQT68100.1 putative major pilin subunit [Anaerohalosphaera lusitana]
MKNKKAFTLIELLVVISIIALLLAIMMPSLSMVKRKAGTAVCLANTKNLSLAWYMYQEDNAGALIGGRSSKQTPWIKDPIDESGNALPVSRLWAESPPVTDDDEIRGIKAGYLYSYLEADGVYNCPSDNIRRGFDGTRVYVSYSIPRCLNGDFPKERKKFSQITRPSIRYNFVENADERNWNMGGSFPLGAPEYTGNDEWAWWGPLAVNHGDSSVLGFCDGHAEVHKWKDEFTKSRVDKLNDTDSNNYGIERPPEGQTEDIDYMARGWATR